MIHNKLYVERNKYVTYSQNTILYSLKAKGFPAFLSIFRYIQYFSFLKDKRYTSTPVFLPGYLKFS